MFVKQCVTLFFVHVWQQGNLNNTNSVREKGGRRVMQVQIICIVALAVRLLLVVQAGVLGQDSTRGTLNYGQNACNCETPPLQGPPSHSVHQSTLSNGITVKPHHPDQKFTSPDTRLLSLLCPPGDQFSVTALGWEREKVYILHSRIFCPSHNQRTNGNSFCQKMKMEWSDATLKRGGCKIHGQKIVWDRKSRNKICENV